MGLAVLLLRLPLGELRDHYGTFDRAVLWSPRTKARARHARLVVGPASTNDCALSDALRTAPSRGSTARRRAARRETYMPSFPSVEGSSGEVPVLAITDRDPSDSSTTA